MEARKAVDELVADVGVEAAGVKLGVAALLYTYRCSIACGHCLFGCSPRQAPVHMSTPDAVRNLRALHELGRVVHIAGGEVMLFWDDLREVLEKSHSEGVEPQFIESNCSFAVDDRVVAERLGVLKTNGIAGIYLSSDAFHQSFVPPERFLRVRRQAYDLFGERNVWCSRETDDEITALAGICADEGRLREYARSQTLSMVGTANRELRRFFDPLPVGEGFGAGPDGPGCVTEFSPRIWEVHIDPYGNIQTNCGVIIGDARNTAPAEVLARGPANANPIARLLADGGPYALAKMARDRHGFKVPATAVSKCDLCFTTRSFLRRHYPEVLGPAELYDQGAG
jgi:hypothetical protein